MPLIELDFRDPERVYPIKQALRAARHGRLRTWLHGRLRRTFSDFDVNAWLGMYPMTFLSTDEWRRVLPNPHGRLLDVGAGSGDLTRALAPLFSAVTCTDTSQGMARSLVRQGFETHRVDLANTPLPSAERFDVVALLHVLDRCAQPLSLFDRALEYAKPGATVVVAVPLPYDPIVDVGARTEEPLERLVPRADTAGVRGSVERERAHIEQELFRARGLELSCVARVPYLCPGDHKVPFYALDSFVFVGQRL